MMRRREKLTKRHIWYIERSIEAARGFSDELEGALQRILYDPLIWPKYLRRSRAARLHRYPYLVVYKVRGSVIQIVSIAHTSRRPGYWAKRRFD